MPSIMPSVMRSRRSWTNSFQSIAQSGDLASRLEPAHASPLVPPLQLDEHVLDGRLAEVLEHLRHRAHRDELAAGEEGQPLAALRLVHVVRRDENGGALLRQRVDPLPEEPPRCRVDAGGRLVEKQHRRAVRRGAGEGQPLLPAAAQACRPAGCCAPAGRARRAAPPRGPGAPRHAARRSRRRSVRFSVTVRSSYSPNRCDM